MIAVVGACKTGQSAKTGESTDGQPKATGAETGSLEASDVDWDGHQRLDDRVIPKHYKLHLEIDPSTDTYSGFTVIQSTVERRVRRVRMHAENLDIEKAKATVAGQPVPMEYVTVDHGGLVLQFEHELPKGHLKLKFEWSAPLDELPESLYRVKDDGDWYAFTQFEPLEARQAFPCFDEPRFKTPFKTSIVVPEGMTAVSNAPQANTALAAGLMYHGFEETRPLPTYLVALAVGDFDVLESETIEEETGTEMSVPFRVLTPAGKSDQAAFAARVTPEILKYQETYFGSEYPYQKLDFVAVPNFKAGAMENVGLVTFRESILLMDGEDATAGEKYRAQSIIAHELAHFWFGNLVTLEWWDDLWLNEAFATWMATKTLAETAPDLEARLSALRSKLGVMERDGRKSARAIRQPIEDGGDVYDAFDGVTYTKGAAVLRMYEAWLGDGPFREGVRRYLDTNAHGTGTTDKLLESLDGASDREFRASIRTFLDQAGVPVVEAKMTCGGEHPKVELTQTRYVPVGSDAKSGSRWKVPVCFRFEADGQTHRRCVMFDGAKAKTVTLKGHACPTWFHPNSDERGYYFWKADFVERKVPVWMETTLLTLREKVALLPQLDALVRSERTGVADQLRAVEVLARETHRGVVKQVLGTISQFYANVYRREPTAAFRKFAARILGFHVERLGFEPTEDEPVGHKLLRPRVMRTAARVAGDETVVQKAHEAVERYRKSPDSVPKAVLDISLPIVAWDGDAALWDWLAGMLSKDITASLRGEVIGALGRFRDPELVRKSLGLFLTDKIRAQNLWRVLGPASGHPATREVAWEWMTANFEAIVDKIGEESAGSLPWVGGGFCSKEGAQRVRAFFEQEAHRTKTTPRSLAGTLESIEQCRLYRDLVSEDVKAYVESGEE